MEEGIETMSIGKIPSANMGGGAGKRPNILQKMTWFLAISFYQSNIVKFTKCNNTACNERDFLNVGFNLQAKVSNRSNALVKD